MTNSRKIKLNKKIAAAFMTVIMVFGIFNFTSFAAANGTITSTFTGSIGDVDIEFKYTNVKDYTVVTEKDMAQGFEVEKDDSFNVSFSPAVGASARVCICEVTTLKEVTSILVPQSAPGMPATLRTYVNLPKGFYFIKIKSNNSSNPNLTTTGSFTIYGVYKAIGNITYIIPTN